MTSDTRITPSPKRTDASAGAPITRISRDARTMSRVVARRTPPRRSGTSQRTSISPEPTPLAVNSPVPEIVPAREESRVHKPVSSAVRCPPRVVTTARSMRVAGIPSRTVSVPLLGSIESETRSLSRPASLAAESVATSGALVSATVASIPVTTSIATTSPGLASTGQVAGLHGGSPHAASEIIDRTDPQAPPRNALIARLTRK
jgi:hypothetical protein